MLTASWFICSLASAQGTKSQACPNDDSGLKLPAGFCATVFADGIGHARRLVVATNGVVYTNTWSGEYYDNTPVHPGGFLVALQDKSGTGKADVIERFGETVQSGGAGGTGIGIYKGSVYVEINDRIVRYSLPAVGVVPNGAPETIVSKLPLGGDHPMHPFIIDAKGSMFWMSPPPPIPASRKIDNLKYPVQIPAPNLRLAAASGVTTQIRAARRFHPLSDSPLLFVTQKVLPSTLPAAFL